MGKLSYYGSRGMPQDQSKALAYYILAARKGDPSSACSVGKMLMKGEGIDGLHFYMRNNDIDPSLFSSTLTQLTTTSTSQPLDLTNEQKFELALLWILRSIELTNGIDTEPSLDTEFDNDDEEDLLPYLEFIFNNTKKNLEENFSSLSMKNILNNIEDLEESDEISADESIHVSEIDLNGENIKEYSQRIAKKLTAKNKPLFSFMLPSHASTSKKPGFNDLHRLNSNICSLNCLGYIYYYSTSTQLVKDNKKSFQFFLLSSKLILLKRKLYVNEGFDSDSIFNIAFCYEEGIGTKVNKKKALKYYNYGAIYGGHFKSIKMLGEKSLIVSLLLFVFFLAFFYFLSILGGRNHQKSKILSQELEARLQYWSLGQLASQRL